jgi:PAS domain S-box-containing protein
MTASLIVIALLAGEAAAQTARPLVFGGDREFPPYEYVDDTGQPQGFNVALVRALAREMAAPIVIQLGTREERVAQFDSGAIDFMFLSYNEERASKYRLLEQTWTLAQVVMMRPGLARYPGGLDDLAGLNIGVDEGSTNHLLLAGLPEPRRPRLTVVPTRAEAMRRFALGELDGVAGNHLTLRHLMGPSAQSAIEVPLVSRPYRLAVLPGGETAILPLRAALDRLRTNGEFDRLVERHLTIRAPETLLEQYGWPLGLGAGMIAVLLLGVAAWNRSLSRQVRARTRAVEEGERQFRDLVENASDMIYRCDPFGKFIFVNPVASRLLGYDEPTLLSMRYTDLIRADWIPRATALYEGAAKSRATTYFEFPCRTADGREIWVGQHVRPILDGNRIASFQGVARDITDRVNAQAELRSERDFVSAILDTAPSLVMVLDREGRVVRFNRACEELTGLPAAAVTGRPIWDMPFLRESDRAEIRRLLPRLVASTAPISLDRVWLDRRGGRHLIAWVVSALRDEADQPVYLIGVGTDVTVARELERLKSQFVSMVSHELRTPLTSIRASLQLLLAEAAGTGPDNRPLLGVALSNAERLIRIVNDILDMSKIEAGELMVSPRLTAVDSIIEESARSVEGFAAGARVSLHVEVERSLPQVVADPDRTIQVLVNLLSNAVKHAPEGTAVDMTASREGEMVAVSVRDRGPGIPQDKLGVIFEPFTQIDGSDTRRIPGTGLGLSIARALAERQGGAVRVASRVGEGATFTVTLPTSELALRARGAGLEA